MDGWDWVKGGALFADHGAGALDGDLAPSLVVTDDGILLVFGRKAGLEMTLLASRYRGGSWSDPAVITDIAPTSALYPALSHDGSHYWLWAGSGSFDAWTSPDGSTWSLAGDNVLSGGGDFDLYGVLYPSVARDADGWRMLYTGFSGITYAIGQATSTDGLVWKKQGAVLEPRAGQWDNAAVAQSALVQGDSGWWAFYGGYDTLMTNPGPYRVGVASDGWAPVGVSLPLGASGEPDAWSTRDPAVVDTDGGWLMVYVGMGEDSVYRLLTARSASCG